MKLINSSFKSLIEGEKLTFLVGAGCSVESPSCLPTGQEFMKSIVKFSCSENENNKIINLIEQKKIRFEALIEIFRDKLDKDLKIIDFFGLCDKPNIQHFYLAEMIKQGHFVITTNFDFLIEHALLKMGLPKEDIIPVITENDFQQYCKPYEFYNNRKQFIYKIHGSSQNLITYENTKSSLITTIQALGSNKQGLNVFQIEPFKRPLLENITKNQTLIAIGYSGNDDFDIIPTIKILKDLKKIIWIDHIQNDENKEKTFIVDGIGSKKVNNIEKILIETKRANPNVPIYCIKTNTTRLVKSLVKKVYPIHLKKFDIKPLEWLKTKMIKPNKFQKYQIPYEIYYSISYLEDSLRIVNNLLDLAKKSNDIHWQAVALNNKGLILFDKGQLDESIKSHKKALLYAKKINDLTGISTSLNNIARIFEIRGDLDKALLYYKESLPIARILKGESVEASILNNIGLLFYKKGDYEKAIELYNKALRITENIGDLKGKIIRLNNLGSLYDEQGNFKMSLNYFQEALNIAEKLGDLNLIAVCLNSLGVYYHNKEEYSTAKSYYLRSLEIADRLGNIQGKITVLNNIGSILTKEKKFDKAIESFKQGIELAKRMGDLRGQSMISNNIGKLYRKIGEIDKAFFHYFEALKINKELQNLPDIATNLHNIAFIYYKNKEYEKALNNFKEAFNINLQLKNSLGKANNLRGIGMTYIKLFDKESAIKNLMQALRLFKKLNLMKKAAVIQQTLMELN